MEINPFVPIKSPDLKTVHYLSFTGCRRLAKDIQTSLQGLNKRRS